MSKFIASYTQTLLSVVNPIVHRGATLYPNSDGTCTWLARGNTYPSLADAKNAVDAAYDAIANSVRMIKNN